LLTRDRVLATYYTKLIEEVNEDIMIFVKCLGIVNNIPVIQLCFPAVEGIDLSKLDRKSTRLNSSHVKNSYAVFCLKKKTLASQAAHLPFHSPLKAIGATRTRPPHPTAAPISPARLRPNPATG